MELYYVGALTEGATPNSNPIFGGQTPLAYLMRGGLPAMQTVRRLLDARGAG